MNDLIEMKSRSCLVDRGEIPQTSNKEEAEKQKMLMKQNRLQCHNIEHVLAKKKPGGNFGTPKDENLGRKNANLPF